LSNHADMYTSVLWYIVVLFTSICKLSKCYHSVVKLTKSNLPQLLYLADNSTKIKHIKSSVHAVAVK